MHENQLTLAHFRSAVALRFRLAVLTGIALGLGLGLGLGGSDFYSATVAVCTASRWGGWARISPACKLRLELQRKRAYTLPVASYIRQDRWVLVFR